MYILTNCIVFSKLKFTDFLLDQFLYLFLFVYKLCQLVAYVLAVAPIVWVSRSITIYSKLLLSHFILFPNKHILILIVIVILNLNLRGRTFSSLLTGLTKPTTVQLRAVEIMRRFYTHKPHALLTYTDDIHTHSELYTIHGTCVNSRKRVPEQFNSCKLVNSMLYSVRFLQVLDTSLCRQF